MTVGDRVLSILGLAPKRAKLVPRLADLVARLYAFADDVLGSRNAAETWMRTPNRALDGARPVDELETEIAAREVEDALGRIRHGIFA